MDRRNDIDWGGWILTVIMLGAFWPVGLVLLFRQLAGYSGKGARKQVKRHPADVARDQQARDAYSRTAQQGAQSFTQAARQSGNINDQYRQTQWFTQQQAAKQQPSARRVPQGNTVPQGSAAQQSSAAQQGGWDAVRQASSKAKKKKSRLDNMGQGLTVVGGLLAAMFGFIILATIGSDLGAANFSLRSMLSELFPLMGFFGGGLMCLFAGTKQRKKGKRYKKYLSYIGKNQEISVSALASAMGQKEKVVYEDLQDMLDDGVLPTGYIDVAEGMLILSDEGLARAAAPQPEPAAEPEPEPVVKKTVEDENAILQEIREVNDAIPDEVMSAKIDRIGEITGKILDYQRSHPSKSGQLRSFLNYYLPTTLKILRAYAQLDAQGIEGENITAAKKRIENMMDMVVDGFESQLDQLFADDALDITSDVQVLENMLRKDGLSGDGMTLGVDPGTADGGAFSAQQAYLDLQKVADELEQQKKSGEDDGQITLSL